MKFIYLYVFLIFLLQLKISFSIEPPLNELNCLNNIVTKYSVSFPINSSGQYKFCENGINTCDTSTGNIKILVLNGQTGNENKLSMNDLLCINFEELKVNFLDISPDLIYAQFPYCKKITYYFTNGITYFTKPFPKYDYFFIFNSNLNNLVLKLSYICNIESIEIRGSNIILENDSNFCVNSSKLNNVLIATKNYPNFSQFSNLMNVTLYFDIDFDKNTINNFATIDATNVLVSHLVTSTTTSFYGDKNFNIKNLIFNGALEKPNNIFDLTGNTNYKSLTILSPGFEFNLNGDFPVKVRNNVTFTFFNGNISKLPDFAQIGYKEKGVNISSSIKNGNGILGIFNGFGYSYDLSSNKLQGTLDESFCNTEVNLYINQMNGTIPSCFSCYLKSTHTGFLGILPPMYKRFLGNSFSNHDVNLPCLLFKPRVEVIGESIKIYGINIGFDSNNWLINGNIHVDGCIPTIFGKEYHCSVSNLVGGFSKISYFSVLFTLPSNLSYTFPVSLQSPPIIDSVFIKDKSLVIIGSFFSSYINYSTQLVLYYGSSCNLSHVDFFKVICSFSPNLEFINGNILNIQTGDLLSSVLVNFGDNTLNDQQCPNDCTSISNGICNLYNGTCVCQSGYAGLDCSSKLCDGWCQNDGICDFRMGLCVCTLGFSGPFCSEIVLLSCPKGLNSNECSGYGTCNNRTGQCHCDENRTLLDCSLMCVPSVDSQCLPMNHYINYIEPTTTNGGEATFGGWFNDAHIDLNISIGGLNCSITFISNETIKCIAPPGHGIKTVVMYQNGIEFKTDLYQYSRIDLQCPSKCSGNGECYTSTGICKCNEGFTYDSYSCSIKDSDLPKPTTNTTIDQSTGGTNWENQEIQFKVYFKSLIEVDYNGNKIKEYPLENNWNLNYRENNIYQFRQTIQQQSIGDCKISSTIEEIINKEGKEFEFAKSNFKLEYGSIKFTISINNYQYENNLNSLKLELISTVFENEHQQDNKCNKKSTFIDTNDLNDLSNFNYIKISKNNKILSARFINKAISDGKPTYLNTQVLKEKDSSIIISLRLPHFINNLIIDPDFSILIDSGFKSNCNDDSSNNNNTKKWLIPVIIGSVVGVAIVITVILYVYRKKFVEGEFKKKLKQFKLSKLNSKK